MTVLNDIYKCDVCGMVIEVVHEGPGELVCCEKPMELLEAVQKEEGGVKHIPIISVEGNAVKVDVGEIPHPMEKEHWITFIELCIDDEIFRKSLNPGDEPSATFDVNYKDGDIKARIYCNIHGLWPSD
ncbi:desulfoferrodoxin [Methanobrevibacter sp. OttesenSCG-928-I08]|nr:desulfoferrodoxin [Methanobrevibacter sp. OttesenSCG-928-I08]